MIIELFVSINDLYTYIENINVSSRVVDKTNVLLQIFNNVQNITDAIDNIKVGIFTYIKLILIFSIIRFSMIMTWTTLMIPISPKILLDLNILVIETTLIKKLFDILDSIKISLIGLLLITRKIKRMFVVIKRLSVLTVLVSKVRVSKRSIVKLAVLATFVIGLKDLIVNLLIITPMLALLTLISPILVLGLLALVLLMKIMTITVKAIPLTIVLNAGKIALVILAMNVIAVALTGFIISSLFLIDRFADLFKAIGIITLSVLAIGGLCAILSIVGILFIPALLAVVGLTAMITSLLLISVELKLLSLIQLDKEKITNNIQTILDVSKLIVDIIWGDTKVKKNPVGRRSWFRSFLRMFVRNSTILQSILSSIFLTSTFISVTMILLVAAELKLITMIQLDKEKIISSVNTVIYTSTLIIDAIFNKKYNFADPSTTKNKRKGGILKAIYRGAVGVVEAVMGSAVVLMSFIAVSLIMLMSKELNILAKTELNQTDILRSTGVVLSTADSIIDLIFNPKTEDFKDDKQSKSKFIGFIKNTLKGIGRTVEAVIGIGKTAITLAAIGMIVFLAKSLKTINDTVKEIDKTTILSNVDTIISITNDVVEKIFGSESTFNVDSKKLRSFDLLTKSLESFIKVVNVDGSNIERNIDNTIKFVDKINTVKLDNLQTATNMFEKMAEFSKSISGNFEGLADTINEKIMPLLEQLNEGLNKTNDHIGGFSVPSPAATTSVTTPSGTVQQQAPARDYTSSIDQLRQELKNIISTLTDGSQRTIVETV